ncbi:DUF2992 domain-containing protein [Paenibacillus sp. CAA11]|uniref:YjdF family protein n=1 Tax=Paenibacillus sp. CAA11 TaxID=1532905 RepID=UPI000D34E2A3|nr:YjdF family protein [Paenibacillus sp. CAA11]AWB46314.1 DUF2992 domain-containing protein [Paenibacillus sp. CAA11]
MKLTVYYENPHWVGIAETREAGKVRAARYVFGSEPSDPEVLEFVLSGQLSALAERMTVEVAAKSSMPERRINPKRLQRLAAEESRSRGAGTYAEQAIKLQMEERKLEKRAANREQREEQKARKFMLARQKAKAKHRGH